MLVIDGRQTGSVGADMNDMTRIMLRYGAINAANMDGGTSSAMELNGEIITNPRNGAFKAQTRPVPNAWIVVKE
jgi:exopolysaccharide biosynthesis protein